MMPSRRMVRLEMQVLVARVPNLGRAGCKDYQVGGVNNRLCKSPWYSHQNLHKQLLTPPIRLRASQASAAEVWSSGQNSQCSWCVDRRLEQKHGLLRDLQCRMLECVRI